MLSAESSALASLMAGTEQLTSSLREVLRSCDHVIGWLRDSGGALQATLRELGISHLSIAPPSRSAGAHQSQRFLQVLGNMEKNEAEQSSQLVLPESILKSGSQCLGMVGIKKGRDYAICHPGSGSPHKCVSAETMAAVIRNLHQQGIPPLIVGGPADEAAVRRVRDSGIQDIPVILGRDLTTIATVLSGARLFVGHDSGLTHLAAVLKVPTVAVFGPTDPRQWAPLGRHVSVVTGPPCHCSNWEEVRGCAAKPCLSVLPEVITDRCVDLLSRYPKVTNS